MSAKDYFTIKGLPELKTAYRDLPDKLKRGVIRRGIYAAARIIAEESKKRAPILQAKNKSGRQPGILKRAIIVKGARELQTNTQVGFLVTALRGRKAQRVGKKGVNKDAYYFGWVHEGHKIVARGQSRQTLGRKMNLKARRQAASGFVKGNPFMRDAMEAVGQSALDAMAEKMRTELSTPGKIK